MLIAKDDQRDRGYFLVVEGERVERRAVPVRAVPVRVAPVPAVRVRGLRAAADVFEDVAEEAADLVRAAAGFAALDRVVAGFAAAAVVALVAFVAVARLRVVRVAGFRVVVVPPADPARVAVVRDPPLAGFFTAAETLTVLVGVTFSSFAPVGSLAVVDRSAAGAFLVTFLSPPPPPALLAPADVFSRVFFLLLSFFLSLDLPFGFSFNLPEKSSTPRKSA